MEWYSVTNQPERGRCGMCKLLDENLCHGQKIYASANSRKGGALLIGHEGIGGRFGGDVEYKVVLSQVSPHHLGISPLIFLTKYYLFHLDKPVVSGNTLTTALNFKAPSFKYSKIDK